MPANKSSTGTPKPSASSVLLVADKIDTLEQKYAEHDQHIQLVFEAIKQLISADTAAKAAPTREIGFHAP